MIDFLFLNNFKNSKEFYEKLEKIAQLSHDFEDITLSVAPRYLEDCAVALAEHNNVSLCSLSLSSNRTYPEVTILEVAMAVENGADEIEIPLDFIAMEDEKLDLALGEINVVKEEINGAAILSVVVSSECFNTFEEYKEVISKILELGVDTITINSEAKDSSEIKYLKESIQFVKENYESAKIKAHISFVALLGDVDSDLCSELESRCCEQFGDFIARVSI